MNEPTYELLDGGRAIRCLICDLTSHNPNDVEQRYCGHCKLFHEDSAIRERWLGVNWIYSEDWEGAYCASAGFFVAGAAPNGDADGPWLLDLEEPSESELATLQLCVAAPDDIKALLARLDATEAEAAALRRLAIAHRNLSMQLAAPGSEQWQAILQQGKQVETALYAAAVQPGTGAALLTQLARAEGLATAATIALHELAEQGSVQEHTRSLLQAAVDAFEAGKAQNDG